MIGMFEFVNHILMGDSMWVISHLASRVLRCGSWCEYKPMHLILCKAQVWCDMVFTYCLTLPPAPYTPRVLHASVDRGPMTYGPTCHM